MEGVASPTGMGLEGGVEAHGTHVWNSLGNGAITQVRSRECPSGEWESGGVRGVLTRQENLNLMSLLPAGRALPEASNRLLFFHLQGYRLLLLCLQGFLGHKSDIQTYITTSLISRSG